MQSFLPCKGGRMDERLLMDTRTLGLIKQFVPQGDALASMSDFFAALGDCTRLKIISALSISELCVSDLSLSLKLNQTTVSHQLKTLRTIGAVKVRRQGRISFYSLRDAALLDIMNKAVNFV